eukprot:COSAG02_NODE_40069_length_409_cov_1.170968_1_plen_59_part_01
MTGVHTIGTQPMIRRIYHYYSLFRIISTVIIHESGTIIFILAYKGRPLNGIFELFREFS